MQKSLDLKELKNKKISELTQLAKELDVEGASGMRKQEIIFALLQAQAQKEKPPSRH